MLIDFHTHAFPDRVAPRAMEKLTYSAGGIHPQTDGTLGSLREQLKLDGVDLAVVNCIATNPSQQHNVNDFAILTDQDPFFVGFGSVHPDAPDALDELDRLHAAGIKGIKFHPEYQGFYANDEKMKPIYRKISQLGMITTFHAGIDIGFIPPYHGMPEHILGAAKWLDTPVVAAHWGSLGCAQQVLDSLCGVDNLYMDLSFGYGTIARLHAMQILEKHGTDKVVFASDMPWHRPCWERDLLATLELSREELEKIFWRNAAALLHLEMPEA